MTIAERIIEVNKRYDNGNMSTMAKKTGVTPAYISKLKKNPDSNPSDLFINAILKNYDVSRKWLVDGIGEIDSDKSREEQIGEITAALYSKSEDYPWILEIEKMLVNMSYEEWMMVFNMAKKLAKLAPDDK